MILHKKEIMAVIIFNLLLFYSGSICAFVNNEESAAHTQSEKTVQLQADEKKQDFTFEKINIDTYKVTFISSKLVDVFELEKGCYLTILDISNPTRVLKFYPEVGKAMPIDVGVKEQTYIDMPLEFKAEKGEFVIFKYEKP
jgi:hypothetical protein